MRFDFRIAVVLGSVGLMLVSVPLTKRSGGDAANAQLPLPQPDSAAVAVAEIPARPTAQKAEAAKVEPVARPEPVKPREAETPRPKVDALPTQPPATGLKLVSVPLPKMRPQSAPAATAHDAQMAAAAKVNLPLPKSRPQAIAAVTQAPPQQSVATPPAQAALVHAPLPKARPQAAGSQPVRAAAATEAVVVADVPMPQDREPEEHPANGTAEAKPPTSSSVTEAEPPASSGENARASVDFAVANPEVARMPAVDERAPNVAEFSPPMPRIRPPNIDRLVLVAEMRKYMGTNPTNRRALWCATFMNMVLNKLGYKGTQSDAARSFVDYGRKIPGPKVGAIAVLSRGPNGGHVGVVSGVDKHGNPIIVSGNHGHRVGVGTYPRSRVLAYVLPTPKEFKRAAARFSERTQRSSQPGPQRSSALTTTQLAARSVPAAEQNDDLPITTLLAAIAAEHGEGRPGSASLRSRASHGKPVTSLLAKFLGTQN